MAVASNSIVIVSCNAKDALRRMLATMKLSESTATEVIVVDNGSFDGSAEMVAREYPLAKLIREKTNRGFAAAAQRGINHAQGDVAVVCHSDLLAEVHTLAELADRVREASGRRVVAAIPRIIGADRAEQPTVGRLPGLGRGMIGVFNPSAARRCYVPYVDHVVDNEWASMTCMAIDLEALGRIGSLDPRFFLFYADADLCQRIHDKDYRILVRRDLMVVHTGASGLDPLPDHLRRIARKDQLYYFQKHRPVWEQKVLNVDRKLYQMLSKKPA